MTMKCQSKQKKNPPVQFNNKEKKNIGINININNDTNNI